MTCSECHRVVSARGYCIRHYRQHYKQGDFQDGDRRLRPEGITCSECERLPDGAHGYCKKHYARWLRGNDPSVDTRVIRYTSDGKKICPRCEHAGDFHPDPTKKNGWSTYCQSCTKEYQVEYRRGEGWKNTLLNAARARSRKDGTQCTITLDDFEIPEFCPVLGVKLTVHDGRGAGPCSASLDRIDPTLGYIPGNVQVMSHRANAMKRDADPDELRRFAAWIIKEYPEGGDAQ